MGLRPKTEPKLLLLADGAAAGVPQDGSMNDVESTYFLVSTELARRQAPALQRAAIAWDPELADLPALVEACCASGDCYGTA